MARARRWQAAPPARGARHLGVRLLAAVAAVLLVACGDRPSLEEAMAGDTGGFVRTASRDRGQLLYARHGCVSCHGIEGHGDGSFGASLKPPPRDFHDPAAFRYGHSIDALARTIHDGVVVDGARVMPAFAHISEADRRNLAAFIAAMADDTGAAAAADTATAETAAGDSPP